MTVNDNHAAGRETNPPLRPVGLTSDFSAIASRYDATRDLPRHQLSACYDRLVECGLFPVQGSILDAGCGTGQISLALAERGYDVLGLDISDTMVGLARAKVRPGWRARYAVGDVRAIPGGDGRSMPLSSRSCFNMWRTCGLHVVSWFAWSGQGAGSSRSTSVVRSATRSGAISPDAPMTLVTAVATSAWTHIPMAN